MQPYDNSPKDGDYIREIERLEALQHVSQAADVQRDADRAAVRVAANATSAARTGKPKAPGIAIFEAMQASAKAGQVPAVADLAKSPVAWIVGIVVLLAAAWLLSTSSGMPFFLALLILAGLASTLLRGAKKKS
jgi:hypothetical protein